MTEPSLTPPMAFMAHNLEYVEAVLGAFDLQQQNDENHLETESSSMQVDSRSLSESIQGDGVDSNGGVTDDVLIEGKDEKLKMKPVVVIERLSAEELERWKRPKRPAKRTRSVKNDNSSHIKKRRRLSHQPLRPLHQNPLELSHVSLPNGLFYMKTTLLSENDVRFYRNGRFVCLMEKSGKEIVSFTMEEVFGNTDENIEKFADYNLWTQGKTSGRHQKQNLKEAKEKYSTNGKLSCPISKKEICDHVRNRSGKEVKNERKCRNFSEWIEHVAEWHLSRIFRCQLCFLKHETKFFYTLRAIEMHLTREHHVTNDEEMTKLIKTSSDIDNSRLTEAQVEKINVILDA